jgi:hypothetical protein
MEKARQIVAAALLSVELTKRAINRSFDMPGMRAALLAAVETDIIIEASGGDERAEFSRDSRMRSPGEMLAIEPSSASKGVWLYVPFSSEVE